MPFGQPVPEREREREGEREVLFKIGQVMLKKRWNEAGTSEHVEETDAHVLTALMHSYTDC